MTSITSAFVLAAGLGTRMQPLTLSRPKPLIELDGRPLLDHVLDRLDDAGVTSAVVNVHYLADQIEAHLNGRRSPAIVISDERDALLDTGGGVKKALDGLGSEPFYTFNSDAIWVEGYGSTLCRMADRFDPEAMDCLMLVAACVETIGYTGRGDFMMEEDGRLARRGEQPVAPFVFAGVCIVHPRLFDGAPDGKFSMNLLWDRAIEAERLFGLRHDGLWMHVGTPDSLAEAEATLTGRQLP